MSTLGASRFTALLAAIAISGMAGTFWWALGTRSDTTTGRRGITRVLPAKFTGRVPRGRDDPSGRADAYKSDPSTSALNPDPNKSDPNTFTLMGRSERAADQGPDRPAPPLLANFQLGARSPAPPNAVPTTPPAQNRDLQVADLPGLVSPPGSRADMPLPALPAPPPAEPDPGRWPTKFPDPQMFAPPRPPQTTENPKRPTRAAPTATLARPPKAPVQSYYMEKYFDQGGYHYRRRPCEPPNMPDVCFMPQANRQPILIARP